MYMLRNRNSTYYARIYFPKSLILLGSPRELRFSLRTKQRNIAVDRSLVVIKSARELISSADPKISPDSLTRMIRVKLEEIASQDFQELSEPKMRVPSQDDEHHQCASNEISDIELLQKFIEFKQAEGIKAKNLDLLRSRVQSFIDMNKSNVAATTTRDAAEFLKSLYVKQLSLKTVKEYIAAVRQFYNWLVVMDYVTCNPFERVKIKSDRRLASEQRRKWSAKELKKLFAHENFTGVVGVNDSLINYQKKLEDYWIPHLLLFTGARVSEICQLHTSDVLERDGVWCISINENAGKTVKTKASIRYVPLHKELLNRGFLNYVNQRYEAQKNKLFDIKPYGKTQCWSAQFGKRFTKVLKAINLTGKDRPTLHGLRHTFIDAAQLVGIPENEVSDIVGHAKQSMTYGRYGKRVHVQRLDSALNKIQFELNSNT